MKTDDLRESHQLKSDTKRVVLRNLQQLAEERRSRCETTLGRFMQCQDLQDSSALLARAVEHCSRWHAGKRLPPPGWVLPPTC